MKDIPKWIVFALAGLGLYVLVKAATSGKDKFSF